MKKLFSKLFQSSPSPKETAAQPQISPAVVERLRSAVLAAEASERAAHEQQLGETLGRAGLAPQPTDSPAIRIAAICHAADKSLAQEWLAGVHEQEALERIVMQARSSEIRQSAAQRITDMERLGRLADVMRDKDRGVYRHCISLIRAFEESSRKAEEVAVLTGELQALLGLCPLPAKKLYDLRKRLAGYGEGPELEHCRTLLQQASQREQDEARAAKQLHAHLEQANSLAGELDRDPRAVAERMEEARAQLSNLVAALEQQPAWLAGQAEFRDLQALLQTLQSKFNGLDRDLAWTKDCRRFLDEHPEGSITPDVARQWSSLPKPENPSLRSELSAAWASLKQEHSAPIEKPAEKPKPRPARPSLDTEAFKRHLTELETAVDEGDLQKAAEASNALDELTAAAPPPRSLADRQRAANAQLGRLRDWARWSGARVRDELIEAAESLLTIEADVNRLSEEVPKLRAEWRRLDTQGMPNSAQRKRFDTALTKAYEPVLAQRSEQNARADAARQAKAGILDEAERWFQELDFEQTPINGVQAHRNALRGKWRSLGHAHGRDERKLNARFDELMNAIEAKVSPCIVEETGRRERLIQAAQRLQTVTELGEAINQARQLQQRWKDEAKSVQLPRKQSEEQWQKFRAAIDAVFARRNAERADLAAKAQQEKEARVALLDRFDEKLRSATGLAQLEHDLAEFREAWSASTSEDKRPHRRDDLDGRSAALIRQAEASLRELRTVRQHELFTTLAAKSRLAAELETRAASGALGDEAIAQTREAWGALPPLAGDIERKLAGRLDAASLASDESLATGLQYRAEALLDLEILLDMASPADLAQSRQTRQLELLQQGFRDRKSASALLDSVVAWHATAAQDDPEQAERMNKIAAKLAEALAPQR